MDLLLLEARRRELPLQQWEGEVEAEKLAATRAILLGTLDELIALGPKATPAAARKVLGKCVERLNSLDETDQFICTIEREDLCEWLYETGEVCGLDPGDEWVDEFREW